MTWSGPRRRGLISILATSLIDGVILNNRFRWRSFIIRHNDRLRGLRVLRDAETSGRRPLCDRAAPFGDLFPQETFVIFENAQRPQKHVESMFSFKSWRSKRREFGYARPLTHDSAPTFGHVHYRRHQSLV
jgi:hypothetical protein